MTAVNTTLTCTRLSKAEINALPLFSYTGSIFLVRTEEEMDAAVSRLSTEQILGFDTETRPSFHKGKFFLPSLLQLASHDCVYLFHFGWLPLHKKIVQLLENEQVVKAGVAMRDDLIGLQKLSPFFPQSVCELSQLAKKQGVQEQGLRGLAAKYLGVRISKGERCSNWSNKDLTPKQMLYAATDAWISREIYLRMQNVAQSA